MPTNTDRRSEARAILSENVRRFRQRSGLTQTQLAQKAGLSSLTISRIENGHSLPEWDIACAIADGLGVSLDDLRELTEKISASA